MKTKVTALIGLLVLMVCSTAMIAFAQGPDGPMGGPGFGGPHGGGLMGHMFHELNLTDTQKAQVKTLMEANKANMHAVMLQMEQNRLAMLQATTNGAYDQAKIQALATQQSQLQAAMTVQHEAMEHQVYTTVLTTEQRAKVDQMKTEEITHVTEHLQKLQSNTSGTPAQ